MRNALEGTFFLLTVLAALCGAGVGRIAGLWLGTNDPSALVGLASMVAAAAAILSPGADVCFLTGGCKLGRTARIILFAAVWSGVALTVCLGLVNNPVRLDKPDQVQVIVITRTAAQLFGFTVVATFGCLGALEALLYHRAMVAVEAD